MQRHHIKSWDGARISTLANPDNNRPVLLFVPGWTMAAEVFARQFEGLADRFRVVSFDPRGQGHSSKPLKGYGYRDRARDLRAVLDWIASDNISIISWSAGVLDHLALVEATGLSEIRSHVFVDGSPCTLIQEGNDWGWFEASDKMAEDFVIGPLDDRAGFDGRFANWMLERYDQSTVDWLRSITSQTPDWVASLTSAVSMFADFRAAMSNIAGRSDVHVIVREEWSSAARSWLTSAAPTASLHALGGHMMFWERSSEFNGILTRLLSASSSEMHADASKG